MENQIQKLKNIVSQFPQKRVLVVGDLMLDEYLFGISDRISPEAPIPVVEVNRAVYVPGGAGNAASNIRSLGAEAFLVGLIGQDENGKKLIGILKEKGIDANGVFLAPDRPTTLKSRIVCKDQHVVRVDKEKRDFILQESENQILDKIRQLIGSVDTVILSDYEKGVVTPSLAQGIIETARHAGKRVLVDTKGGNIGKYRNCFAVVPNFEELEKSLKTKIESLEALPQAMAMLLAHLNSEAVFVTLGERGMAFLNRIGEYFRTSAADVSLVDISGAGDTAIAVFALALASGASPKQAMFISTYACSVVIGKVGTAVVSQAELIESFHNTRFKGEGKKADLSRNKLREQEEVINLISSLREQGKIIVATSGSFDIFHPGHIKTLREAKSQGDVLVVLLNSDKSARGYKGPNRPINNQEERAQVLSSVDAVDYITVFDELIPNAVLEKIKPDIYCVGPEWGEGAIEQRVIEKGGGKIYILGEKTDISTSKILEVQKYPCLRAVFIDRDGVINKNEPEFTHRIEDFKFRHGIIEGLERLSKTDFKIIITTNQSGIARGYFTEKDLDILHSWMLDYLKNQGIRIDRIYYCPHHPDFGRKIKCDCRKPKPGMLLLAAKDFYLSLDKSWIIGDGGRDILAGRMVNAKTIFIGENDNAVYKKFGVKPHHCVSNFLEAVDTILKNL